MIRLGLLGHPVGHALSPALHTRWLEQNGVSGTYVAHELPPDTSGADVLQTLDALGWSGANLTVPFKTRVIAHLDSLTPIARRIGAVNTLVRSEGGWSGSNTDVDGVHAELEALALPSLSHGVVLGAGGAARAVVVALQQRGCPVITVLNRSAARTRSLLADLQLSETSSSLRGDDYMAFAAVAPSASVVVNTTSGPAASTIAALSIDGLSPACAWLDLNYWMSAPPWLATLKAAGHPTGDGRRMLVHQGAVAFERFTGRTADPRSGLAILASNLEHAPPRS